MKIVVIGGTGLIGSKTVPILRQGGHKVVAASPKSGVNTITGEGLKEAMAGATVVIDLANSPSFEDKAVLEFFETLRPQPSRGGGRSRGPAPCRGVHRSEPTGRPTMAIFRAKGRVGRKRTSARDSAPKSRARRDGAELPRTMRVQLLICAYSPLRGNRRLS